MSDCNCDKFFLQYGYHSNNNCKHENMSGTEKEYRYNVLTGLVSSYCKPYRTTSYFKAVIALIYRRIRFGRGWISTTDKYSNPI